MALCIHRAPTPKRFSLQPPRAALRLTEHRDAEEEPALTASTGTAVRRSCTRRKGAARAHPQHTPCIHKQPHHSPFRVQCLAASTPKLLGNPRGRVEHHWDKARACTGCKGTSPAESIPILPSQQPPAVLTGEPPSLGARLGRTQSPRRGVAQPIIRFPLLWLPRGAIIHQNPHPNPAALTPAWDQL